MRKIKESILSSDFSVTAGKEVFVQGVRSIAEYSDERVRLRLCDMTLCILGAGLTMKSYYDGSVRVCGSIGSVSIER